jgi:integrase
MLLDAAKVDKDAADMDLFCAMSLETGPRVGELLGLPWSKVNIKNLDAATIAYSQQGRPVRGGEAVEMSIVPHTKNFRRRTIPISHRLAERLRDRKESNPGALFVFADPERPNQPMHYDYVKNGIDRIAKAAGLSDNVDEQGLPIKNPGPHDLRHTFATMAANELNPLMGLADLAYMLGDNKDTVAKHYLHHNDGRLRAHMESAVASGLV